MRVTLKVLVAFSAALILGGIILLFGAVQSAAAEEDEPTEAEVWWLMPNGGTPDNVTWPQPLLPGPSVQCGAWAQVDTYPVEKIMALTADLKLDYKEDWGIALHWRYVYGGDCSIPTETEVPSSTSTPSPTTTSTPPTGIPTPTGPSTGNPTTPTVKPTTPDTPSTTPSTATSQPIGSEESSTSNTSTQRVETKPQSGAGSVTNTKNRLADTGSDNGTWVGFGVLILIAGLILLATAIWSRNAGDNK